MFPKCSWVKACPSEMENRWTEAIILEFTLCIAVWRQSTDLQWVKVFTELKGTTAVTFFVIVVAYFFTPNNFYISVSFSFRKTRLHQNTHWSWVQSPPKAVVCVWPRACPARVHHILWIHHSGKWLHTFLWLLQMKHNCSLWRCFFIF